MNDSHANQLEMAGDDLQLFTPCQVAQKLQISLSDVRRKIKKGIIPSIRLGPRQVRVRAIDLRTYILARPQ